MVLRRSKQDACSRVRTNHLICKGDLLGIIAGVAAPGCRRSEHTIVLKGREGYINIDTSKEGNHFAWCERSLERYNVVPLYDESSSLVLAVACKDIPINARIVIKTL